MTTIHVLSHEHITPDMTECICHTAIENLSDPIGYLHDFTNPYYTALAGNMKACAKKDNSF
jgi:hypothetical protein